MTSPKHGGHSGGGFRPEIQGLRAVAVALVLVFHVWPSALPGGYVGVDVFFVISGFLITGLLLREVQERGRISITGFYAKRIKRLLPAATVVLMAVATCISLLPMVRWQETAYEIAASALYVENWWLAGLSVDYLAADSPPSPVTHFWSLSVEEQYYIIWPLLFAVAAVFSGWRSAGPRRVFIGLLVPIGLLSLAYSIYLTPRNPGLAYFATTTRVWELALGGFVAVQFARTSLGAGKATLLGVAGLVAIVLAAFTFGHGTPFPGYHALLPTVGAALVIMAGQSHMSWSPLRLLNSGPFQYLGDISYSLYLWHWPVIVFYQQISQRDVTLIDGVVVLVVSTALAHQTKFLVEDRFRVPGFASSRRWMPFAFAGGCIGLVLGSGAFVNAQYLARAGERAASDASEGALAITPSPAGARSDNPVVYALGCHVDQMSPEPIPCAIENPDGDMHVMIVGDSHAVQWVPALQVIAKSKGWRLSSHTKSACAFSEAVVLKARGGPVYESCREWSRNVTRDLLATKPDLVLLSLSTTYLVEGVSDPSDNFDALAAGIADAVRPLVEAGIRVVAIRDTPRLGIDVAECMSRQGATQAGCSRNARPLLARPDPLDAAAVRVPAMARVDMNPAICPGTTCPPVIGGLLVWRDSHHLTATFARSLAPELESRLDAVLADHAEPD
ncbi:acyltransferase [Arenimonas soli]|uniref:Acyltransferase n=1 Tax=Arenimonas soli TaxID=2269504 RepID=A0ABQ1H9F6_9GAMM|nr:acyltransferase family protein [Arenimonas soli]GGA66801.1 acyltransferase [Arenimonas soli]